MSVQQGLIEAPEGVESHQAVAELDRLADILDSQWRVPGLGIRFGVDAVAGLVPVIGDLATGAIAGYIVLRGASMGAPPEIVRRMTANVVLDVILGSVPILGSVFDIFFKANRRNLRLLRRHFAGAERRSA